MLEMTYCHLPSDAVLPPKTVAVYPGYLFVDDRRIRTEIKIFRQPER